MIARIEISPKIEISLKKCVIKFKEDLVCLCFYEYIYLLDGTINNVV